MLITFRYLFLIWAISLASCTTVTPTVNVGQIEQVYQQGLDYYHENEFSRAAQEFRYAAEAGHLEAPFKLANLYYDGEGVQQNSQEAAKWYSQAARRGHADAQYMLGALYAVGSGVPQNYEEARYWYQQAAEQGHVEAQLSLGVMYYRGTGRSPDLILADKWLAKAAAHGNQTAIELQQELQPLLGSR
jgi:hypothetical protein